MNREKSKSFKDMIMWQKSHHLVISVFKDRERFLKKDMFGLTSKQRRAIISEPANYW